MPELPSEQAKLVALAIEARDRAYAPYSGYSVGAALLDENGRAFVGVNVENAAYGSTICAERSAICTMVSAGGRKIQALVVATEDGGAPCGACLQVISEFADLSTPVVLCRADGTSEAHGFGDFLPLAFTGDLLNRTKEHC